MEDASTDGSSSSSYCSFIQLHQASNLRSAWEPRLGDVTADLRAWEVRKFHDSAYGDVSPILLSYKR